MAESLGSDEEDDYLSMVITEPKDLGRETSARRYARKRKEAELRGHPKSKAERIKESSASLEMALSTQLDSSNKGFKMLQRLGYKPGDSLGIARGDKYDPARLQPIAIDLKNDRAGIGLPSEKRKFSEGHGQDVKQIKIEQDDFRTRKAREKESARHEAIWQEGLRAFEMLEEELVGLEATGEADILNDDIVKERTIEYFRRCLEQQRNPDIDKEHRGAFDRKQTSELGSEEEKEDESLPQGHQFSGINKTEDYDHEMMAFESYGPEDRVTLMVGYLRARYHYCIWCKQQYKDSRLTGCPGANEADHDRYG